MPKRPGAQGHVGLGERVGEVVRLTGKLSRWRVRLVLTHKNPTQTRLFPTWHLQPTFGNPHLLTKCAIGSYTPTALPTSATLYLRPTAGEPRQAAGRRVSQRGPKPGGDGRAAQGAVRPQSHA